jgi:hypothetical protein
MSENIIKFNGIVSDLLNIINNSIEPSQDFNKLKIKINLLINNESEEIIENLGQYLYEYREYIKSEDHLYFMKMDTSSLQYSFQGIINLIKTVYQNYNTNEKKIINKKIQKLLSYYCKYKKSQ